MVTKKKTTKKTSKKKTKRKVAGRAAAKKRLPGWIILLIGMLFGLVIAVGGYIYGWVPKPDNPNKPVASSEQNVSNNTVEDKSEELKIEPKNNFDFYTSLQDMEVDIDENQIQQTQNRKPKKVSLQLGSFRSIGDAETLKAQVAFTGLSSHIQSVEINNSKWHRVVIGPYKSSRKADVDRRKLENSGFNPIVVKQ